MATWIDFKKLREQLSMLDVLNLYQVEIRTKGDRATGLCPLPDHPQRDDGTPRTASFSCNLPRKIWHCFGCGAGGNVLDLAVRLERKDPTVAKDVRAVAVKLAQHFGLTAGNVSPAAEPVKERKAVPARVSQEPLPQIVNPPLDFELQGLDPAHPYFAEHGITPAIVTQFGLGFCNRGRLKHRIAIPIHDEAGQLVGYAGRLTKDQDIAVDNPKYRFPGDRERDGKVLTFAKSRLVYNLHRLTKPVDLVIVVEGFRSVWWLTACGYANVVAVMGSSCSPEQADRIESAIDDNGRILFLTDGDDAGEACAVSLFRELGYRRFCRWLKLEAGLQPTDLNELALSLLIE